MARSESADDPYERAQAYFRAGNFARCRELVEQHLAADPHNSDGLKLRGMVLLELYQPIEAIEALRAATQFAPDDYEAWSQLGIALLTEGSFESAAEAFRAGLRLKPNHARMLLDLGNVLFMLGRKDEAVQSISEARRLRPGDLAILRNLSGIYISLGQTEAALATVQEILEFNPGDIAARCQAARLLLELRRLDEAAEAFREIRRDDPERDYELLAIHGQVMVEIQREDWRQALLLAIEATKLDRYDFTTSLLSYISSKLFDQSTDVTEEELYERFEDEYIEIRSLHGGQSAA